MLRNGKSFELFCRLIESTIEVSVAEDEKKEFFSPSAPLSQGKDKRQETDTRGEKRVS